MSDNLRTALVVAYRNHEVSERERDAVLSAIAEHLHGVEGETAARILQHRREAQSLQMNLNVLLVPTGGPEA